MLIPSIFLVNNFFRLTAHHLCGAVNRSNTPRRDGGPESRAAK
jgi:hypothetical protein